jgi:hypothetical protein
MANEGIQCLDAFLLINRDYFVYLRLNGKFYLYVSICVPRAGRPVVCWNGKDLYDTFPLLKNMFEIANEILGYRIMT